MRGRIRRAAMRRLPSQQYHGSAEGKAGEQSQGSFRSEPTLRELSAKRSVA